MSNISRRLDQLEARAGLSDVPYPPVFRLIDNPSDPDNPKRLAAAVQFRSEHPDGVLIHRIIVSPPEGRSNWEQFHASGAGKLAAIADRQAAECSTRLDAMIARARVSGAPAR